MKTARRATSQLVRIVSLAVFLVILDARSWAAQNGTPAIGVAAVDFRLQTLDGKLVRLERFRGRALIMNFFASWCDPCREEVPLINALASRANENGYAVLGIAIQDRRATVIEFVKETGAIFPVALDLDNKVQRAYRVLGPPATCFIDGQGLVRDIVLGPLTPERMNQALKKAGVRD